LSLQVYGAGIGVGVLLTAAAVIISPTTTTTTTTTTAAAEPEKAISAIAKNGGSKSLRVSSEQPAAVAGTPATGLVASAADTTKTESILKESTNIQEPYILQEPVKTEALQPQQQQQPPMQMQMQQMQQQRSEMGENKGLLSSAVAVRAVEPMSPTSSEGLDTRLYDEMKSGRSSMEGPTFFAAVDGGAGVDSMLEKALNVLALGAAGGEMPREGEEEEVVVVKPLPTPKGEKGKGKKADASSSSSSIWGIPKWGLAAAVSALVPLV
jgi:hypothetical protein